MDTVQFPYRSSSHLPFLHVVAESEEAAELLVGRVGPGDTVLVKGSRGMRMERAVEALAEGAG